MRTRRPFGARRGVLTHRPLQEADPSPAAPPDAFLIAGYPSTRTLVPLIARCRSPEKSDPRGIFPRDLPSTIRRGHGCASRRHRSIDASSTSGSRNGARRGLGRCEAGRRGRTGPGSGRADYGGPNEACRRAAPGPRRSARRSECRPARPIAPAPGRRPGRWPKLMSPEFEGGDGEASPSGPDSRPRPPTHAPWIRPARQGLPPGPWPAGHIPHRRRSPPRSA